MKIWKGNGTCPKGYKNIFWNDCVFDQFFDNNIGYYVPTYIIINNFLSIVMPQQLPNILGTILAYITLLIVKYCYEIFNIYIYCKWYE